MKSSEISLYLLFHNILSLTIKTLFLVTFIMSNLVLLFSEGSADFGDGYIQNLINIGSTYTLKYFKEFPTETILFFTLYILIITCLISTVLLLSSKIKTFNINTYELQDFINEFKSKLDIPRWVSVKINRNNTCSKFYCLFVSIKDLSSSHNDFIKFKMYHEKCHLVSLDSFLSIFDKSLCLIVICIVSMLSSSYVESLFNLQGSLLNPLIIIFSFVITSLLISKVIFYPTRFKEYLCDLYAFICTGFNTLQPYKTGRLDNLLHPNLKRRAEFIIGKRHISALLLIFVELIYWGSIYFSVSHSLGYFDFLLPFLYCLNFLFFINYLWLFKICES